MEAKLLSDAFQAEIFNEYLVVHGYSPKTRKSITEAVNRFVKWVEPEGMEVHNVIYNDILSYVNHCREKVIKPKTIEAYINSISHYYDFLISRNELTENPCSNIDIKDVKRRNLYEAFTTKELENIYNTSCSTEPPNGMGSQLTHKRNKVILGLLIYQGLRTEEVGALKIEDINIYTGEIKIEGARRTNERELTVETKQFYNLIDYINTTRKSLLEVTGKTTNALFISMGSSDRISNAIDKMLDRLKRQYPKIKSARHIRASVITNWLQVHNIRRVQYLAGHRYISSTEAYKAHDMNRLKDDIRLFHPNL